MVMITASANRHYDQELIVANVSSVSSALNSCYRCGTCPQRGTCGIGSTGTCCGSSFGFCSDVHTCRTPASAWWSSWRTPGRDSDKYCGCQLHLQLQLKITCKHFDLIAQKRPQNTNSCPRWCVYVLSPCLQGQKWRILGTPPMTPHN